MFFCYDGHIGINEKIADACRIEHVVNSETMARLTKFVEFVQRFEGGPRCQGDRPLPQHSNYLNMSMLSVETIIGCMKKLTKEFFRFRRGCKQTNCYN